MQKKIVVINASARKGWNTDTILNYASSGVAECGANCVNFNLYRLEKYTGCISCFGCKREKFKGKCICKDGLTPVLNEIYSADGLIIGSPNYFSDFSSSFKAFYERLVFPYLTYNVDNYCCNERRIPVLLIMTSNAPDTMYVDLVQKYKEVFEKFVGPTKTLISGNTLQIKDYSKTDWQWSLFNAQEKYKRHNEIFPKECERAKELGRELVSGFNE